ncbi:MAG TPA: alpha amylase C-terminal domain-containing protein, partial [Cellvibrionaceae bacterium]
PAHTGIMTLLGDLNRLYKTEPALYSRNYSADGFAWIDCHDNTQSVISYRRIAENEEVIVILNFTPVLRKDYRIGLPEPGQYRELFNSDSSYYGGSDQGNHGLLVTEAVSWMNLPCSVSLTVPPLGAVILKRC